MELKVCFSFFNYVWVKGTRLYFYALIPAFWRLLNGWIHVISIGICYLFVYSLSGGIDVWIFHANSIQSTETHGVVRASLGQVSGLKPTRLYVIITSITFRPNLSGRAIELELSSSWSRSLAWSLSVRCYKLAYVSSVATVYSKRPFAYKFSDFVHNMPHVIPLALIS